MRRLACPDRDGVEPALKRCEHMFGGDPTDLPSQTRDNSLLGQPLANPRKPECGADRRSERKQQWVESRRAPKIQRKSAPLAGHPSSLGHEVKCVRWRAVLEGDVTEGNVNRIIGKIETATIGYLKGVESFGPTVTRNRLVAAFEESDVEVSGDDMAELAGERSGHAANARSDLNQSPRQVLLGSQPKGLEVRGHLVVATRDELGKGEMVAGGIVKHPPGLAHDIVATQVTLGEPARHLPRNQLRTSGHRARFCHFRSGRGAEYACPESRPNAV